MPTSDYFAAYHLGQYAYSCGCFEEATLHFQEARSIAQRHGDDVYGFKALVWAADSSLRSPKARSQTQALALLFEAAARPHVGMPEAEVWAVNRTLFDYYLENRLDAAKALSQINRLSTLSSQMWDRRASEVALCTARYALKSGEGTAALIEAERAWSLWVDLPCALVHSEACDFAIQAAIRLGRLEDARRWLETWRKTDVQIPDMRLRQTTAAVLIALAETDFQKAEILCERQEEEALGVQGNELIYSDDAFVRATLLQSRHGDPEDHFHPARARMLTRRLHTEWLRVDYRLACVRWAASIDPTDDLFWRINSAGSVPKSVELRNKVNFTLRVAKAQSAIDRASNWAKIIDARFECDWRLADFCERQRRLNIIVQAAA